MSSRILLVRHGHVRGVDAAGEAVLLGWTDIGLDALGRDEAGRVAARLREEAPTASVYTSPLLRARQTARAIRSEAPIVEEALREISCGVLDGAPIRRVRREHPALFAAHERQDDGDVRWPGGESYRELRTRASAAMDAIAARHPGETVIAVTHTGIITQVVGMLAGMEAGRWGAFRAHTASITEVSWGRAPRRVVRFDDREHLRDLAA